MSNRPRPPTRHATPTCRNAKQRRRFRLIRREQTQSPCGQAGPRAAGNHDLEVMACMVQQVRQRVDHRSVADPVPIVDDDVEMCSARLDFVDERGHNLAFGFLAAAFELMPKSLTRRGPHAANGIDQVGEKPHHVVVIVVDRQPCHGGSLVGENVSPLRGKCGLNRTSRARGSASIAGGRRPAAGRSAARGRHVSVRSRPVVLVDAPAGTLCLTISRSTAWPSNRANCAPRHFPQRGNNRASRLRQAFADCPFYTRSTKPVTGRKWQRTVPKANNLFWLSGQPVIAVP